ncbi:membrane protease subunit HflK [Ruminiclostridium sufflavum DSM 19573]|uniref:Protein HflK n=1 Tax=Ruminiclostridium sufflavum DSM 19573 TaxID=1121337 RepID=A0A318XRQ5_9FIRM|nr:FtsH protease activity modulator HflK [Ruminiclostridium sufflavum]PYG90174.1 membrane protease subunit HflK [Ruminiclostridium sufflavum DSM 19573]
MNETNNSLIEQSLKASSIYIKLISVIVIIGVLLSGVTFVQSGEVAVVLRFGKLAGDMPSEQVLQPGIHFCLPFLIDKVIRIPVQKVQEVKIDDLYTYGSIRNITQTGYALTGDNNIVVLEAVLKYRITDPVKYTLEVEDPAVNLKELATCSLTREISSMSVDRILTDQKKELAASVLEETQNRADLIGIGVQLVALEITSLQPPGEVKEAFDLVTSTNVKNETLIQEAKKYKEKLIPEATAERDTMIQGANSYKLERVAQANSDVAQFYGVLEEYRKNPLIVHERLYRERVENIMKKVADTVLVPKEESGGNIILP